MSKNFIIMELDIAGMDELNEGFSSLLDAQDEYIDSNIDSITEIIESELKIEVEYDDDLIWNNSYIQFIKLSDNSTIEISFNDFVHLGDDSDEESEEESPSYKEFLSNLNKLEPNKIKVEFRIEGSNE